LLFQGKTTGKISIFLFLGVLF